MKHTIPAIIFAGGKSSRMGKDKALLPFKGYSTLSEFQYHKLEQWFDKVYLSSKTDKFPFKGKVIKDLYDESSPLVGLISVFETLESEAFFVLSVDAPLLNKKIIEKLYDAYKDNSSLDAVIAQSPSGLQPLCGIYKRSILIYAKENFSNNQHSLKALLDKSTIKTIDFKKDVLFTNINTQDEYLNLLSNFS